MLLVYLLHIYFKIKIFWYSILLFYDRIIIFDSTNFKSGKEGVAKEICSIFYRNKSFQASRNRINFRLISTNFFLKVYNYN